MFPSSQREVEEHSGGGAVNVKQMTERWEDLLHLAALLYLGTISASLLLRKLALSPHQDGLAWAFHEVGRIEKAVFPLAWLQGLEPRRRG